MKEKVVIVGAREDGHAKVVLHILLHNDNWEIAGFIDDDLSKKGLKIDGFPWLGTMADLPALKSALGITAGIVAIGHNGQRRALAEQLLKHDIQLINAIHPSVIIDRGVKIGAGNYLGQGVIIVTGSRIGSCVNIHTGATVDHDNRIADGANLGPGVHTSGRVKIGRDAFIGVGSSLIPDVEVGEEAIVGAGTVVIRNVEPGSKVVGNPARRIGMKTE